MSESKIIEGTSERDSERFKVFVESSPLGISIMKDNGTVEYVNSSFVELFGYTLDDILGGGGYLSLAFPDPKYRQKALSAWFADLKTSRTGQVRPQTFRVRCKDNSYKTVKFWPMTLEPGLQMFIYEDLTERKLLETQLVQAQKMEAMGGLAGGIAHDFNNILSAIMGNAEIALYHLQGQPSVRYSIEQILKASQRARDLVRQILAFSRQTAQELRPVEVGSIVREALKLLRATLPASIEIRLNQTASNDTIMADPTQIHQVLINLCTNAQHAMSESGGVLEIGLSNLEPDSSMLEDHLDLTPGTYLKVSVSDTGQGMPPETLDKIFEPYFTTKEMGVGTGLGLTVIHGIVKNLHGVIMVASTPGQGTRFDMLFPSAATLNSQDREDKSQVLLGTERVLFVDDEEFLADLGGRMLEQLGYEVNVQTDSLEALKLFKSRPHDFDLIITDMSMPKMSGDKLAQQILLVRPDIPIVLCTGFSTMIDEASARKLGIKGYLMKPFVTQQMAKAIRLALGKNS